jgi:hypothetical protein
MHGAQPSLRCWSSAVGLDCFTAFVAASLGRYSSCALLPLAVFPLCREQGKHGQDAGGPPTATAACFKLCGWVLQCQMMCRLPCCCRETRSGTVAVMGYIPSDGSTTVTMLLVIEQL